MLFLQLNKKRKIKFAVGLCIIVIYLFVVIVSAVRINKNAEKQKSEFYTMGEEVKLENNFFFDVLEHTDGYTVCVDRFTLKEYESYITENGGLEEDFLEYDGHSKYVCLVDLTVKNSENADGYINTMGMILYYGSLQLSIDYTVWNLIDKNIDGNYILKLRENSEATITIPFTSQQLDEYMDADRLNQILEKNVLRLVLTEYPVRKIVEIHV